MQKTHQAEGETCVGRGSRAEGEEREAVNVEQLGELAVTLFCLQACRPTLEAAIWAFLAPLLLHPIAWATRCDVLFAVYPALLPGWRASKVASAFSPASSLSHGTRGTWEIEAVHCYAEEKPHQLSNLKQFNTLPTRRPPSCIHLARLQPRQQQQQLRMREFHRVRDKLQFALSGEWEASYWAQHPTTCR